MRGEKKLAVSLANHLLFLLIKKEEASQLV